MSDIAPRSFGARPTLRRFSRRTINDIHRASQSTQVGQPAAPVSASSPSIPKVVTAPWRAITKTKPALPRQHRSLVLKRQIVDRAAHHREESKAQRRRTLIAFAFGGVVASLLFGVGFMAYALFGQPTQTPVASAKPETLSASTSKDQVSEQAISTADLRSYRVAAGEPRMLTIPKLGIQARIKSVGADFSGVPVPTGNIHDAGWFKSGPLPGTTGAALINGHVTGLSKPGVFTGLADLAVGDVIQVERGDGVVLKFKVVRASSYPADGVDMKEALRPVIAGKNGLNLLTNTGRYNTRTNQFEPRTIVFTVQE